MIHTGPLALQLLEPRHGDIICSSLLQGRLINEPFFQIMIGECFRIHQLHEGTKSFVGNPYVAALYKQVRSQDALEYLRIYSFDNLQMCSYYLLSNLDCVCGLVDGRVSLWMCRQPVIHRHSQGVCGSYETSLLRCVQARFLHHRLFTGIHH